MATSVAQPSMTYARARLWLGITSVGSFVTLASLLLAVQAPQKLLVGQSDLLGLFTVLLLYVLLSLPFDVWGGLILPRRYRRTQRTPSTWLRAWGRGVIVQMLWMLASGMLILAIGRAGGTLAAAATVGGLMLVMLILQAPLARLVAHFSAIRYKPTASEPEIARQRITILSGDDQGFVGGHAGLPGWTRLVVPSLWFERLPRRLFEVQLLRKIAALQSGTRTRGVLLGLSWNLIGFLLCSLAPGADVSSVAGLTTLSLWFTLWSFLGLLWLPTPSRNGVLELDYHAQQRGASAGELRELFATIDRWQEDEPDRAAGIERIFHPVPNLNRRLGKLGEETPPRGAYHAARMALPLSWSCLGMLGRAVHCNCGRPELWVMLPGE